MCGVLNVIPKPGCHLDPPACRRALSSLLWRGPDHSVSTTVGPGVFLGQTVLSLVGAPCDSGRYPSSPSGRYSLSFNGEIYNYRELAGRWLPDFEVNDASTDTDVLAALHDTRPTSEVAGDLDGMYAFTVFDHREDVLTLCRDVQGEKSLYVYEDERQVIVSSEIRAIEMLVGRLPLDRQVLRDYFRTRHFMPFERTCYPAVRQVPPGAIEQFDVKTGRWARRGRRSLRDWLNSARLEANRRRSIDDLADELDALLVRCAKETAPRGRRYAAVVSGGVDSSLVAWYLVRHANPDRLVAVDHVGKDRISSDLSGFEEALGRSIDVTRVTADSYSAEVSRCLAACGGPLPAHSFVAQSLQSANVSRHGCRAIFGGDAADELFGGYQTYMQELAAPTGFSPSDYTRPLVPEVTFDEDEPGGILAELAAAWAESTSVYDGLTDDADARIRLSMMYCDLTHQLPAVGLRGADLMSMAWSVECRTLLLRRPIVEFALSLPLHARLDYRLPGVQQTKVILKRLFLRAFPANLLVDKQGFAGFPNESAVYLGDLRDYLAVDELGIRTTDLSPATLSAHTRWKLANIEYFLRARRS